jgi:hypothetical protein
MNTCPTRAVLQQKIDMITESLRPLARKGVLYGSQVCRPSLDRDIDVFVISVFTNRARRCGE